MALVPDYVPVEETPAERIRAALDLYALGERMFRQRLRNDDPNISESEIDATIAEWLARRPGAEYGDMPGVPSERFR